MDEIEKCKKATAKALDNGIMSEIQKLEKKLQEIPNSNMDADELK
jgi:hypothetical protein